MDSSPDTKLDLNPLIPNHIAIIMDGNGRWAKERGKERIFGHGEGANRINDILKAATKLGVKYLTLYAFSSENWNRPKEEVEALMNLLVVSIKQYGIDAKKNGVRFKTIGNISALPVNCIDAIRTLEEETKDNTAITLVLALNYGSRDEIVRAVSKIVAETKKQNPISEITWETIANHLDSADMPDPDLIIRTSGEQRLSNFLMLQAAYAELYFTNVYWPDFTEVEFLKAIKAYNGRNRRYGKTQEQIEK